MRDCIRLCNNLLQQLSACSSAACPYVSLSCCCTGFFLTHRVYCCTAGGTRCQAVGEKGLKFIQGGQGSSVQACVYQGKDEGGKDMAGRDGSPYESNYRYRCCYHKPGGPRTAVGTPQQNSSCRCYGKPFGSCCHTVSRSELLIRCHPFKSLPPLFHHLLGI